MGNRITIIDGVTVTDITPEMTEEEQKRRTNEVAEGLIMFSKNRSKDKTA